jgi:cellulose synthase/poly-beta-1,6-N-acetylglucosamine synthase-like glycosyltransferase
LLLKKELPLNSNIKYHFTKDVFIIVPICNESIEVIERFIDKTHVFQRNRILIIENSSDLILKSNAINALRLANINYLSTQNFGNKALALNFALTTLSDVIQKYKYLVFLDIDQIPTYSDLSTPSSLLKADNKLVAIQFKEYFVTNNIWSYAFSCIQSVFTEIICPSKSLVKAGILLGGNFIIKSKELYAIGLFYSGSIMEDVATSLILNCENKHIEYLPEFTCESLCPSSFWSFLNQQRRYIKGSLEILKILFYKIYNNNLTNTQKISYIQIATVYLSNISIFFDVFIYQSGIIYLKLILLVLILIIMAFGEKRFVLGIIFYSLLIPIFNILLLSCLFHNQKFYVTKKNIHSDKRNNLPITVS